jgi:restriction system protein
VFVGDSTFKTDMPGNVTYAGGYVRYIKSKKEVLLSDAEVADVMKKIESGRLTPSMKTNREHVNHVKNVVEDKKDQCPKCGSELVVRVAKKGANAGNGFLGCSGFPKCRYAVYNN